MWFLGIDIGTTHIKVVGVTLEGVVLDPLKIRTPVTETDDASFHDGDAIWSAVRQLVGDYAAGPAARAGAGPLGAIAVGTFGQEESFPVDDSGAPLAGSRVWWENWPHRSIDAATVDWFDSLEHYRVSGMRFRDNQSPDRIAQLREHQPEIWAQTRRWVDFGSYVTWKLTGRWLASSTQVTHSQFFDLATLEPHPQSLAALQLDASLFAPAAQPGTRIGEVAADALPGVALQPDAAVYVGGHDQVMAAYASAITDDTNVVDSIGTAEYVMVTSGSFEIDRRLYDLGADVEHGWGDEQYVLGWGLPSGKILQLLAERFCDGDFEGLMAAIDTDEPGAEGVQFTVNDLRSPGAELLTVSNVPEGASADAVVRACVTQLSERIRNTVGVMTEIGGTSLDSIALTGSLFQRPEMVRHRERTWKVPLRVSSLREAAATGAAELARSAHARHSAEPQPASGHREVARP
jgi:sugar (pentulose or hexulose) kinase